MPLKPIEQFVIGGVDSRSNPINFPPDRCLLRRNFLIERDGSPRLRDGYTKVNMIYVTTGPDPGHPGVRLSFKSLNFGQYELGYSSQPLSVLLTNIGDVPLNLSSLEVAGDFALTDPEITALAPHASCSLSLTFTPTVAGARSGTLTITDDAADSPQVIALSGIGVALVPGISLSTTNLSMGTVDTSAGGAISKSITITNTGKGTLVISSVAKTSYTGPDDAFSVSGGVGTIPAGQTATITVTFDPSYRPPPPPSRSYTATFSIVHNAADSPTAFSANGLANNTG